MTGLLVAVSNHGGGIARHLALTRHVVDLEHSPLLDLPETTALGTKVRRVRRELRSGDSSTVVTHGVAAGLSARLRGRGLRAVRHVEFWHGDPFFGSPRRRAAFRALAAAGRSPEVQVFTHEWLAGDYGDARSERIVLPNAVPVQGRRDGDERTDARRAAGGLPRSLLTREGPVRPARSVARRIRAARVAPRAPRRRCRGRRPAARCRGPWARSGPLRRPRPRRPRRGAEPERDRAVRRAGSCFRVSAFRRHQGRRHDRHGRAGPVRLAGRAGGPGVPPVGARARADGQPCRTPGFGVARERSGCGSAARSTRGAGGSRSCTADERLDQCTDRPGRGPHARRAA